MPKLLAILSLLLLIQLSCKKNDKLPEKTNIENGVTNKASYTLYEIGSITFANTLAQGTVIQATVNGTSVKVAVVNDSLVAFSIIPPTYNIGVNEITFESGGKTIKTTITVTSSTLITNPEDFFTTFISDQQKDVTLMQGLVNADSTGALGITLQPILDQTKSTITAFSAQWGSLSGDDKKSLASYLNANHAVFNLLKDDAQELFDFTLDKNNGLSREMGTKGIICATGTIPVKYKCFSAAIKSQLSDVFYYGTLAAIAGATIPVTAWAGLAVAAVPAALGAPAFIRLSFVSIRFLRYHFYIAKVIAYNLFSMVSGRETTNEIDFVKDEPTPLTFTVQMRNLQQIDNSSSISWINELANAIDKYNLLCDKLGASQFKWMYSTMNVKDFGVLDLTYLTVSNISNPTVTGGVIGGTLSAPTIKFTSNSNEEQLFTFNLNYNDGVNKPIIVTVEGKLKPFGYIVGFLDGSPVPATQLTFSKDESKFFTLLNSNGSSATGVNYSQVSISGITNPNVTVVANNVAGSSFSIKLNTTSTTTQTTYFDVLYQSKKLQTLNAMVDDSTEYYKSLVPGVWLNTWDYDFDNNGNYSFYEEDKIILNADGTALWTEARYYTGLVSSMATQLNWRVYRSGNLYLMSLGAQTGRITQNLSFPNTLATRYKIVTHKQ